jgi:hypothetical protein
MLMRPVNQPQGSTGATSDHGDPRSSFRHHEDQNTAGKWSRLGRLEDWEEIINTGFDI